MNSYFTLILYVVERSEKMLTFCIVGKCIPWTKSLGPLELGPVQVIFSWTKWGVFLGPIPVGPGIKLPVEPCFYN